MEKNYNQLVIDWIYENKKAIKPYGLEDLYFLVLEANEKTQPTYGISNKTYKELCNLLISSMLYSFNAKAYQMGDYSPFNNNYGIIRDEKKEKMLIDCFDLILDIKPKIISTTKDIYYLHAIAGEGFTKKHNLDTSSKAFLELKFEQYIRIKESQYKKNLTTSCSYEFYNEFINELEEFRFKIDEKIQSFKVGKFTETLRFVAFVELGYEPSKAESFLMFDKIWAGAGFRNYNEIGFFCDTFSKTNLFKNSFAPTKNMQLELQKFFKEHLVNLDEKKLTNTLDKPYPHEDKLKILFNHPSFLQENIKKRIILKENFLQLGKKFIKPEEQEQVIAKMKEKDAAKNVKKMKI